MIDEKDFNKIPEKELYSVLEGLSYFACVHRPNYSAHKKFNQPPTFELKLGLDTPEQEEKALELGLKILEPTDYVPYRHVELKRKVKDLDKPMVNKPQVIDTMQNEIPEDIFIGNGSRVRCRFFRYWHQNVASYGVGKSLLKVQVLDLVPYEKRDTSFVSHGQGFVVGSSTEEEEESNESDIPFDIDEQEEVDDTLSDPFETKG